MISALRAIIWRELLRFWHQRSRFFSALVRPLVWLFIFGAGFRAALGLSIIPPYQTYILYETYMIPGLCAMIILFQSMQSSLSMVYDREMGAMRLLLTSPQPRWWLLTCKLIANALVALVQSMTFLLIAWAYGIHFEVIGLLSVIPALLLTGIMLGALGLALSALITQLQNFAGVMNFIIFPMFFLSTALYPLWRIQENAPIVAQIVTFNPFTYAVEFIRFALYRQLSVIDLVWVLGSMAVAVTLMLWGYNPRASLFIRKAQTS